MHMSTHPHACCLPPCQLMVLWLAGFRIRIPSSLRQNFWSDQISLKPTVLPAVRTRLGSCLVSTPTMKAFVAVVLLSCLIAATAQHADLLGLNLPDFEVVDSGAESFVQSVLQREQQGPANVLIKYLVPPPVQKEFIQVFKEVKDETTKEEGNKMYFLLKPITDNVSYYIYGQWETAEDYAEHLKSDHTKKLLEFDYKKGVVFKLEPLLVVD